jgi:hypothetical protein
MPGGVAGAQLKAVHYADLIFFSIEDSPAENKKTQQIRLGLTLSGPFREVKRGTFSPTQMYHEPDCLELMHP